MDKQSVLVKSAVLGIILMSSLVLIARKPNVIIVLADDMGYGDLSCLNPDSKLKTTNLDRLAEQGIQFSNAHSSGSTCVPSRYGLMTGRMPWRRGDSLGTKNHVPLIDVNRLTLPKLLKQAGYDSAAFGKWHLGWHWPWRESVEKRNSRNETAEHIDFSKRIGGGPLEAGFDYLFGVDEATFPNAFIENGYTVGIPDTPVAVDDNGKTAIGVKGWDIHDMLPGLTRKVVEYINNRKGNSDPFFIYFAMTAPHTPLVPTPEFKGTSGIGPYGDFVLQCDDSVGQVLDALKRNGLVDNTLVIFTSDNGSPAKNKGPRKGTIVEETGHNPSGQQSGFKGDAWEGGHHVPFIVRWPGKAPAGAVSDDLFCQVDLLGTFAALTGQSIPVGNGEDSLNALPLFLGDSSGPDGREYLVHRSQVLFHSRKGEWKLIFGSGSGGLEKHAGKSDPDAWQLYNLKQDPGEKNNLYTQFPEIEENLERILKKEKQK